jgi:transposase
MNREEREEYVVQLYKENNSIREIARLVHMSFRDIGVIINKAKLQAEREKGYAAEDTQPKSPESQAFKLFSEGKSTIEVAIQLDLAADRVRAIYREYWELSGRYRLTQIYDEARYDLRGLLRLHKIVKDLGMEEHDIINVFELAKYNELQNLQWKVEYLRNEVNMLEMEKWESTNHLKTE